MIRLFLKNTLRLSFALLICHCVNGQQVTQFTHFVANAAFYNPAIVGGQDCMLIKSGHRNQWVGFEGAPRSTFLSVSSSLKSPNSFNNSTHVGVGGYFQNETHGSFKKTTFNASYAYSFLITQKSSLAFGAYLGVQQLAIDAGTINLFQSNDPIINGTQKILLIPDAGAGLFIKNKDWYVGYSLKNMMMNNWENLIESNQSKLQIHHFLMAGKRFYGEKINLIPNVLFKYSNNSIPSADINLNMEFAKVVNFGVSWRNMDALSTLFRINILDRFHIYYAYDVTTSKIQLSSNNTHEFIIGFKSCPGQNKSNPICPLFY